MIKKFGDDEAGSMAALIAYYGFVSLFPLLLVLVTVLGFVLEGDPKTQAEVLHSTLSQFPIIGDQLQSNVHSLKGSVGALAIGVVGLLLGGLGIVGATQNAFQQVWHIPRRSRPNFLTWRLRGIGLLAVLGLLLVVSTVAAGYVTAQTAGTIAVIGGVLIALASNLLLFFAAFRFLSPDEIQTRDLLTGVVFAAVLWQILQHIGGYYVAHVVRHAQETSGPVRVRAGPARLAVSRRSGDADRGGDQRRTRAAAVAAQLHRPAARRGQARADLVRGDGGARPRGERRGDVQGPVTARPDGVRPIAAYMYRRSQTGNRTR